MAGPGRAAGALVAGVLILAGGSAGCTTSGTDSPPVEASAPAAVLEGTSTAESGAPCVPPTPLPGPAATTGLSLPPGAVLTASEQAGAQVLVSGRVREPVRTVLQHFRDAAARGGYVVQRDEDEGRSGMLTLFGARGTASVVIAALTCPRGQAGFTVRIGA